jgi:uncharacterized protein YceH (UPF0502 family)
MAPDRLTGSILSPPLAPENSIERAMELLATEIRVLASLLEKQRTTPDAYPLTLNALRAACNQSTNRDPVVQYSEAEVRDAVQRLERRGLLRFASGAGSRAAKFRHLLAERLPMDDLEQAVMCVLMLRGAQTPGELKQRGERIHAFADLAEVEQTLLRLIERDLVRSVPRRPGQKEERYVHLLGAAPEQDVPVAQAVSQPVPGHGEAPVAEGQPAGLAPQVEQPAAEIADLRERVARLEHELQSLKAELGLEAAP